MTPSDGMVTNSDPARFGAAAILPDVQSGDTSDWRFLSGITHEIYQSQGAAAAIEMVETAIAASPSDGNLRMILGDVLLASGRHVDALTALSAAMHAGTEVEILNLIAAAMFPGPRYQQHLLALHQWLRPATYLEIGVFKGDTLALAQPGTRATGVDPQPRPEASRDYDAPTEIRLLTSDAYFAARAAAEAQPREPIDLAFIDGLHLFEQVLRDFINVEKYSHAGSVIVLHDTLPAAPVAAARQRQTSYWCGDVWKIRPCLQKFRPDLAMLTIPTHPSGLTFVAGLDNASRVLTDRFEDAVAAFAPVQLVSPETGCAGDIANDFDAVRAWLSASPARAKAAASGGG